MVNLKDKPFYLSDENIRWVKETIESMTLNEKIGQLFCPIGIFDGKEYLEHLTKDLHIGGLLFREDEGAKIQAAHRVLQQSSKVPLFLAANVETGGNGIATDGTGYGEQMNVAAADDESCAYMLGKIAAIEGSAVGLNLAEGSAVGLNLAFGPIVDIDMNYRNPITNVRTFGSNADKVMSMGINVHRGLKENGLASCAKHFPGDGVDDRDQHLLTSVNNLTQKDWDNSFGMVYKAMIDEGVLSIMAGHIMLPAYQKELLPATLSKELLQGLLRDKLGFNGMIITDATPMVGFCCAMPRSMAVPYSIEAGCDMFLFNKDIEEDFAYMKNGIESGVLSKQRLNDALTRILGMKAAIGLHTKQKENNLVPCEGALSMLGRSEHIQAAKDCIDRSITLVKDIDSLLPLKPGKYKRILLEVVGGFESDKRVAENFKNILLNEGFEVTVYEPEDFTTLETSVERFKDKYDLVLYAGNIENISNKTVSRISWHTMFGQGNNIPWFAAEIPIVFVGVGNPYLMQDVPMIGTFINAYYNSNLVIEAVVDKLLGKSEFKGKSPIDPFCGRKELYY